VTDIVNEIVLPHPIEAVWRALTDSDALAAWLMPNDFEPRLGHRFTFRTEPYPPLFNGIVHCEVVELDAPRRLAYTWSGGPLVDTVMRYTLSEEGAGTRLVGVHSGFDDGIPEVALAKQMMSGGWETMRQRLLRVLEDATSARTSHAES
jgi:uncharacterized protein YndB with AHSA1/START domain